MAGSAYIPNAASAERSCIPRFLFDLDDEHGNVVGAPAQIRQANQGPARFRRQQKTGYRTHFDVGYLAAQAVATE